MERVQCPRSKQAPSAHLLSGFSPPREPSSQYPVSLHYSSQALPGSNGRNVHQEHQASPWPPLSAPENLIDHLCSEDGSGLSPVSPLPEAPVNNATVSTRLLDECIVTDKMKSFSQPSVIAVPFSCELDLAAAKSRSTLLASLSSHMAEGMDRTSGAEDSGSFVMKAMDKPNAGVGGTVNCISQSTDVVSEGEPNHLRQKRRNDAGGAPSSSSGDIAICLKLGKRTYFGDTSASVVGDAKTTKPSATRLNGNTCNSNGGGNSANVGNGGNAKKLKASSPAASVPRCQAEDCKMDLSGAKDYHRRHKVCEWHSKSSKVKVSNMYQRFCQQCSRFHVLSEFDEGKRSCRRRLAGHNERRRKPQPEPFSYAYLAGAKLLFGAPPLDRPYILNQDQAGADFKELKMLHKVKEEPTGNYTTMELHEFLQGPLRAEEHQLLGGSAQALLMSNGYAMNLSRPPAPLTSFATCPSPDHHPETLVSGRALSLLSSSLGFPKTSYTVSRALGVSCSPSLEGNFLQIQHAAASSPQIISRASCLNSLVLKDNDMLSLTHNYDINMLPHSESTTVAHCLNADRVTPSTMLAFVGDSSFPILPGSDIESDASTRPVLDLMQLSFAPPQTEVDHHFADLEGLSVFGRQRMM
ncbi:hypothetical protein L7F22_063132 [Adiantum nelumboides]|nr:hypothetical protein [Adiantum nelumboides]